MYYNGYAHLLSALTLNSNADDPSLRRYIMNDAEKEVQTPERAKRKPMKSLWRVLNVAALAILPSGLGPDRRKKSDENGGY